MPDHQQLFGLSFRTSHYQDLMGLQPPMPGMLEILTENHLHLANAKASYLDHLASRWSLALHGVSLSIGGSDPLNKVYLQQLKKLAHKHNALFVTDHLCWTSFARHNTHDLLPLPYSEAMLQHVTARVDHVQEKIGRRLYLENPSAYVSFQSNTLEEADFLASLVQKTGCGILLDVNNLYVSHKNLGLSPDYYLSRIHPEWLCYLHIAGHSNLGDILVDTHDHPMTEEVWALYRKVIRTFPHVPTVLEWDGDVPPLSQLMKELSTAEEHQRVALTTGELPVTYMPYVLTTHTQDQSLVSWKDHQKQLFTLITNRQSLNLTALADTHLLSRSLPASAETGLKVYRDAYWVRLIKVIRETYPSLTYVLGKKFFANLISDYLEKYPPVEPDIKYAGQDLSVFLRTLEASQKLPVTKEILADIAALEWAKYDAADDLEGEPKVSATFLAELAPETWPLITVEFSAKMRVVHSHWRVGSVIEATSRNEVPDIPVQENAVYLVRKYDQEVEISTPRWDEYRLMEGLRSGKPFEAALLDWKKGDLLAEDVTQAVNWLSDWCSAGMVTGISTAKEDPNA